MKETFEFSKRLREEKTLAPARRAALRQVLWLLAAILVFFILGWGLTQ